jgi:hypothetical protein
VALHGSDSPPCVLLWRARSVTIRQSFEPWPYMLPPLYATAYRTGFSGCVAQDAKIHDINDETVGVSSWLTHAGSDGYRPYGYATNTTNGPSITPVHLFPIFAIYN